MTKMDRYIRSYAELLLRFRWLTLGLTALFAVVAAYGMSRLEFDTTFRIWHPPDSPELAKYDARLAQFGSDETMLVVFRDEKGMLRNDALTVVRRLTDDIWRIPSVKRVDSLANFAVTRASRVEHESWALAATKDFVIAAGDQNDLLVWDRNGWNQRRMVGHEGLIEHLALSPDGRTAYSASQDRSVRIWDLANGTLKRTLRGLPESVSALSLSPDGKKIVAGSFGRTLVWDAATGNRLGAWATQEGYVTAIAWSPDGARAYVAGKQIEVWNPAEHVRVTTFAGRGKEIHALAISSDGSTLYSAGEDGVVLAHATGGDPSQAKVLLEQPGAAVLTLRMSPSRALLVAGLTDGTIRGISLNGGPTSVSRLHDDWVMDLAVAEDGTVYSAGRDRNVGIHVPGQGPKAIELEAHRATVRRLILDPNGQLLTMGDEGDVYVWSNDHQLETRLYRSFSPPAAAAVAFQGERTGKLTVVNGFRFPIEILIGGRSRGSVLSSHSLEIPDVVVPDANPCESDDNCSAGSYCDYEKDPPSCTGQLVIEAVVPGRRPNARLWSSVVYLTPGEAKTVRAPTEDPFSVIEPAEAALDPRSRVGGLLEAFPKKEDRAALEPALEAVLGPDAKDPLAFVDSGAARELVDRLAGATDVSPDLITFLGSLTNEKVWPFKLPLQPLRLREIGDYLMRGPVPLADGVVLNQARDTTAIAANLHVVETMSPLKQASDVRLALEKVVEAEHQRSGYDFHLAGDAIQDTDFERFAQRDIQTLFPLFAGMVIIVLSFWYRRPAGVFLPLGLVMLAVMNTMGFAGIIGEGKLNNMTVAVPQVVLACCVGDLNHVFSGYLDRIRHGEERRQAVINTVVFEFVPCFWTAATTSLGFFSMTYGAAIRPIAEFGWMGGIAAMAAWFGTFTVMPCVLFMLPIPKKIQKEGEDAKRNQRARGDGDAESHTETYTHLGDPHPVNSFAHRMDLRLVEVSRYVNRTAKTIIFMAGVTIAVATYGLTKVSFDTNAIEFFSEQAPFRRAVDFAQEHITGPTGLNVLVDTGEPGGIRKVEHLEAFAKIHDRLRADGEVTTVAGLAEIMRGMNRVMNNDLRESYRTPDTADKASSYYNAYTFSLPAGLELTNRVSADESSTLIDVRLKNHPAVWVTNWGHDLEKWASQEVEGVKVSVTSKGWIYATMLAEMSEVFFMDIFFAVLSISLVMFFLARNVRLGFLAMLINLLPLYITVGLISLAGKTLDISVLISCSVAMGIVVDDTIHYVVKYKRLRADGMDHAAASEFLAQEHSKASIATTLVLVGGFAMFVLTDYQLNRNFGLTTATMLCIGLLFDLLILPAGLALWGPKHVPKG